MNGSLQILEPVVHLVRDGEHLEDSEATRPVAADEDAPRVPRQLALGRRLLGSSITRSEPLPCR